MLLKEDYFVCVWISHFAYYIASLQGLLALWTGITWPRLHFMDSWSRSDLFGEVVISETISCRSTLQYLEWLYNIHVCLKSLFIWPLPQFHGSLVYAKPVLLDTKSKCSLIYLVYWEIARCASPAEYLFVSQLFSPCWSLFLGYFKQSSNNRISNPNSFSFLHIHSVVEHFFDSLHFERVFVIALT